jgi:hypothetical protein
VESGGDGAAGPDGSIHGAGAPRPQPDDDLEPRLSQLRGLRDQPPHHGYRRRAVRVAAAGRRVHRQVDRPAQLVAEALPAAPRRSIELGVAPNKTAESGTGWDNISHSGPNQPNPAELDPGRAFDGLFAAAGAPPAGAAAADPNRLRRAYLDAVMADASDLQRLLPARDRHRMEA